jgi:4-amino-4-deoxy-L-arabinose transferase-like glycosyltransferase
VWLIVLVLPWFFAIIAKSGESFFAQSLGQDMLAKVASGQEGHGAPPGYYLLLYWIMFWPGSVLTAPAVPAIWKARREPGAQFLLAWLVPSWIVFELVMTKLPHYVLPLYPAIAILIAGVVEPDNLSKTRLMRRGPAGWFVFPLVMTALGVVTMIIIARDLGIIAWPFAAAAMIFGLFAWWLYDVDGAERSLLRGMVSALFLTVAAYAVIFPSMPALFPSAQVAETLRASKCQRPVVAAAGYQEPSLVFLLGTETRMTDGAGAAEFLRQGECRFALIDAHDERSFLLRADAVGLQYSLVRRFDGYNVTNGRQLALSLFRSTGTP